MAWIVLILGIALWWGAHLLKRVAPEQRAALGADRGKGIIAGVLFGAIVLMVIGYRWTPFVPVWGPPSFLTHINNLLILVAFYLMSPAPKKGIFLNGMRHPMLTGFALWAGAHLLVNGDLTAILTFGGLLAWAVVTMRVINTAEPEWTPNPKGEIKYEAMGIGGSVVLLVVVGYIHFWLGVWPFG